MRRPVLRHPLLVFGLLLVGPAAGRTWVAHGSVRAEWRVKRAEAESEARLLVERAISAEVEALEAVRRREEKRPYFHYQQRYMPEDLVTTNGAVFVASPLNDAPEDPRVLGWFQWSLGSRGAYGPDVFGPSAAALRAGLSASYAEALAERLRDAARSRETLVASVVRVSLPAVAANEEQGQLREDIEVSKQEGKDTAYLRNFQQRVAQKEGQPLETVDVRATPFSYAARPSGQPGPALVAYRIVWIPGQASRSKRDAPTDRWLLQGYALDPGRGVPARWELAGANVFLCRGDCPTPPPGAGEDSASGAPPLRVSSSLMDRIRADVLPVPSGRGEVPWGVPSQALDAAGRGAAPAQGEEVQEAAAPAPIPGAAAAEAPPAPVPTPDPSLAIVAAPAVAEIEAARGAAERRFFLLAAGLAGVVGIGFGVLLRSVRREMAVARKREDFVAAVTHELKTPLASIRMYADMRREGWVEDGAAAQGYAARIVAETQRLGGLVDQVLDHASVEHGVAAFHPVRGDLGAAVREGAALLAPASAEAGVPVRVEVEDALPPVEFDPALVRRLGMNLVDNAIKYSARSPVKDVRVSLSRARGGLALVVADRGAGIPAADRRRVFEPFYRAGHEETRTARGVGLGHSLVARYPQAHRAPLALPTE